MCVYICPPAELGVEGEFAWLPWADTLAAFTAVLAAYMLASSWNFPIFFLYRIRLFPNQLDTWPKKKKKTPLSFHNFTREILSLLKVHQKQKWHRPSCDWLNLTNDDKTFVWIIDSTAEIMLLDLKRNKVNLRCLRWRLLITVNLSQKLDVSGCPISSISNLHSVRFRVSLNQDVR